MKASGVFAIIACLVLAFLAGAWWQFDRIRNSRTTTTIAIVERQIILPSTHAATPATPIPPDSTREHQVDSLIAKAAKADSLEQLLRQKLVAQSTVQNDSIAYADSVGSFHAKLRHFIGYDPLLEAFSRTTTYSDAHLSSMVRTDRTYMGDSWLERFLWGSGIAAVIMLVLTVVAK